MADAWLQTRIVEIRERMTSADEGSLWTLFFDDPQGAPVIAHAIDGGAETELNWLPNYAQVLGGVGAAACLLAVVRRDGRPKPEDRQLWRELQVLLRGTSDIKVLGFLVVGTAAFWCAPGSCSATAA
jgi:hypothetical protein